MQAALPALPELDRLERDAIAAPDRRAYDVVAPEDLLDLGDPRSSASRLEMTRDCGEATAPICEPRGREAK